MLIGASATLLLLGNGRIAGISGMLNGAISFAKTERWRWIFLLGLVLGAALYEYGIASSPTPVSTFSPWSMILGGFWVGFGTRMGNGCTSGHGVCGLGRLSGRSLAAVMTFLVVAMATVLVLRLLGLRS
ncbi:YeeE/YedE family protein [Lyngbya confervoides]|uniref:YeeE/YedE family protein n=1 Tax=Lyngbya confervoides BDU141951 TaxID=1574623 RepID=A0ABD4T695_9CYAN|nr:YeeE/YedE thiosulfate transporter family protein [Lyngbya confervoides]MCM1984228.1 YeeE/YedE family protein [Lyngbya confervoides BDU141951]